MTARPRLPADRVNLVWSSISLLVLLICFYYAYIAHVPPLSFETAAAWRVISSEPCASPGRCVQVGDQILSIGGMRYDEFRQDRGLDLLDAFDRNGKATLEVLRNGKVLTVEAHVVSGRLHIDALTGVFPIIFWLMGTATMLFLRPRDERWLVLVLFSYVTAIWLASGLASGRHTGGSAVVFHVFIWLFMPLCVHLHLILPDAMIRLRTRIWLLAPLYASAFVIIVLDYFRVFGAQDRTYVLSFLAGVILAPLLLVLRLVLPSGPAVKLAVRTMLYGVALGFGPILLFFLIAPLFLSQLKEPSIDARQLYPWLVGISMISIPIMPMSYIYAIYKHHIGALELRANRLLGSYSFFSLSFTLYLLALFFVSRRWPSDDYRFTALFTVSLVFVASTPFLHGRFQALVDRHVFGIRHTPEEVIGIVSERISTAFDRAILNEVVTTEILPTLLIRQSALYFFGSSGPEPLYEQSLPSGSAPTEEDLEELLFKSGRYLDPRLEPPGSPCSWVRLALPLVLQGETLGVWLIGRRDPDDYFPRTDIHLLSTVANQVAAVLENIHLYEQAQQEIAQRRIAEREIRRSEERFRNLFEATLEGIALVKGGQDGVILEVNHALLAIFGYTSADKLIGRRLSELISESESVQTEEPHEGFGFRSDGSRVDIETAGKQYVFQGEDVTVVAIRDVTRRKRDEAENRMLQGQLLHSQKMEAIGRLSAGVAHDFNNCLLAIFGYSDLLLGAYRDEEFLGRNLSGIKEAAQKAAALTRQLLTFARRQPLETRVMDLNQVVAGIDKMLRRLIGEDIELATDLYPEMDKVKIDPGQMEQVLLNLAVNARHAMPDGGRLMIRTAPVHVTPRGGALHADVPPGSYIVLTVADTGFGMDAATQARIFEPFFTTKEVGEGTGLGLSTAYGIVRQSNGHIFVDSAPGQGARFTIYLPVSAEETAVPLPVAAGWSDTGSETILLVEDEPEARAMLLQTLLRKGYRVLQAASGDEALALADRYQETIHLLLTDVVMPRMKGPDLAARLLVTHPNTRVLYMSGYNEESLPTHDARTICLQKPFPPQLLTQMIRAILDADEVAQAV